MRLRRIQLAGLAMALGGAGVVSDAAADDLVITNATTNPVSTSAALNGTPGNITINAGGSITIPAGTNVNPTEAVTLDELNRNLINNGLITSVDADYTTGVRLVDT